MALAIGSSGCALSSLALAVVVALSPVGAFASALAPASPRDRSQVLLVEGDAALERGELDKAISMYSAAYYGLTKTDQASYVGSLPVRKAMEAYEHSVARVQEPTQRRALLERQRALLDEFLDGVATRPGAAEEIGAEVMAELEQARRSIDDALATLDAKPEPDPDAKPKPDPDPKPEPEPEADPPLADPTGDEPKRPRDWLGLGLTIGGSTLLATGAGVCVGWWTVRNGAQELVDGGGEGFAEGTQARADYLLKEDALARKYLIAGTVVAGVGLATAIGGVVHLALHRRRHPAPTALLVAPLLAPTLTGVALHRRF